MKRWLLFAGSGAVAMLSACAPIPCGFAFFDVNGQCVSDPPIECNPACNEALHEVCEGTTPNDAACVCAPGYEGIPCEWVGALKDPGFQNSDAWETSSDANVEALSVDADLPRDPGKAVLTPSAVCSSGKVGQQINMPSYEAAEPFVVEVTYRAEPAGGLEIGFDRAWKRLAQTEGDEWEEGKRFCVGEAAYGGLVDFQIAPSEKTSVCRDSPQTAQDIIEVDRVEIVLARPEDKCPRPGEVFNGDAEREAGGWRFDAAGEATADFDDEGGRAGGSGARLHSERSLFADDAAMTTRVSVPLPRDDMKPALRFWWKGSSGALFQTELGTFTALGESDRSLGTLRGSGAGESALYCLPPWTYGNVVDLSFQLGDLKRPEGESTALVVDELEVVHDARCGTSSDIFDPGFESAPVDRAGVSFRLSSTQAVETVSDEGRAHSGAGFLEITYSTTETYVLFETWVFVPPPEGDNGPVLTFHSFVEGSELGEPEVPVRWFVGRVREREGDLRRLGMWDLNDKKACLPPEWAGRWYRFQVWVANFGPPPPLYVFEEPKTVRLDDFAVGTAPECPSE